MIARARTDRIKRPALERAAAFLCEYALAEEDEPERGRVAEALVSRLLQNDRVESAPVHGADGSTQRLSTLLERLEEAGFMPSAANSKSGFCLRHCPFGQLPLSFPELCVAEHAYLEGHLGVEVRRTAWRVEAGTRCCYRLRAEADRVVAEPPAPRVNCSPTRADDSSPPR